MTELAALLNILLAKYSIGLVFIASVAVASLIAIFFGVRWVIQKLSALLAASQAREMKSEEREKALLEIIAGFKEVIATHTASDQAFAQSMGQANQFQRDEHRKMIELLEGELTAHARMTAVLDILSVRIGAA